MQAEYEGEEITRTFALLFIIYLITTNKGTADKRELRGEWFIDSWHIVEEK